MHEAAASNGTAMHSGAAALASDTERDSTAARNGSAGGAAVGARLERVAPRLAESVPAATEGGMAAHEVAIEMATVGAATDGGPAVIGGGHGLEDEDDGLCIICFERAADHVLLTCGHGGFCRLCAYKLLVRPPHHCPTCRTLLEGAVCVPVGTQIGGHAEVKAPG